uniref:Uncharacterized protein n=1 Tax=Aegilops tauschii TaxID=37682 RepID=M8CCJ8_AEGTA
MADAERQQHGPGDGGRPHFLIVAYGIQSHLNPCRVLARRLVQLHDADGSGPVLATLSPATVLATYYHYFHGYGELIASHAADPAYEVTLPGLSRPLRIRDFPSFLVDTTGGEVGKVVNAVFCELFEFMDEQRRNVKVLVNTFDELEPAALAAMREHMDVFAVGPVVGSSADARIHLFNHAGDDKMRYMEWLGAQPARRGRAWGGSCGWNSTLEAMALGVAVVAAPSPFAQPTNAMLIEEEWAAGVRGERNGEGIFSGPELARCVELVMGDGARAVEVRKKVESLKGMARDAMAPGGPAERNLRSFVMEVQSSDEARRKDTNTISPQP